MFSTRKTLVEMKDQITKIENLLESNEIKQLRKDSDELKTIKELLSHVKFKIKDVRPVENQQTGNMSVVVTYELPRIVLDLDEQGEPMSRNDFFYSTNKLNLISLEDMSKFNDVLRQAQRRIKRK